MVTNPNVLNKVHRVIFSDTEPRVTAGILWGKRQSDGTYVLLVFTDGAWTPVEGSSPTPPVPPTPPAPSPLDPLKFTLLEGSASGTLCLYLDAAEEDREYISIDYVEWSYDNENWTRVNYDDVEGNKIEVAMDTTTHPVCYFRGSAKSYYGYGYFGFDLMPGFDSSLSVEGGIMSMLGTETFDENYTYHMSLIFGMENLCDVSGLVFPNTVAEGCYAGMFSMCINLTTGPAKLPATTLASHCYQSMFSDCTSLTTMLELPATTLAESCYYEMFANCYSLEYVKMLATDITANDCLNAWLPKPENSIYSKIVISDDYDTTALGAREALQYDTTYYDVFNESGDIVWARDVDPLCIIVTNVGVGVTDSVILHIDSSLDDKISYFEYSQDKENWTRVNITGNEQTINLLSNIQEKDSVYLRGQAVSLSNMDTLHYTKIYANEITTDLTVEGNILSLLGNTDFSKTVGAFYGLFSYNCNVQNVDNLILPNITAPYCYANMFYANNKINISPVLVAPILAEGCYAHMFEMCRPVGEIMMLATDVSATDCLNDWVYNTGSDYPSDLRIIISKYYDTEATNARANLDYDTSRFDVYNEDGDLIWERDGEKVTITYTASYEVPDPKMVTVGHHLDSLDLTPLGTWGFKYWAYGSEQGEEAEVGDVVSTDITLYAVIDQK